MIELFSIQFFALAGESVLIAKTDQQAQEEPCAFHWNADRECPARHRELHAHDDLERPFFLGSGSGY